MQTFCVCLETALLTLSSYSMLLQQSWNLTDFALFLSVIASIQSHPEMVSKYTVNAAVKTTPRLIISLQLIDETRLKFSSYKIATHSEQKCGEKFFKLYTVECYSKVLISTEYGTSKHKYLGRYMNTQASVWKLIQQSV